MKFKLKTVCCEVIPIIVPDKSSLRSVNFFLVKQQQSLSLIDAGWNNKQCWNALNDELNNHGFCLRDLTEIILTHHHIDHIGLVNRITAEHPVPVYAHPDSILRLKRDRDFLEMRVEFYSQLYKEMGCGELGEHQVSYLQNAISSNQENAIQPEVSKIVDDPFMNFNIVEVPGHAPDQLAFYNEREKWVFAGDLLISHISSNALVEPDSLGRRIPSLTQHVASLKKCLALNVNVLFPGHGDVIEKPNTLIKNRLKRVENKAARLTELINAGVSTGSDIALSYYKNTYYEQFSLVMSEIIGHLDYLEVQGKIKKELVDGVWHYSVN